MLTCDFQNVALAFRHKLMKVHVMRALLIIFFCLSLPVQAATINRCFDPKTKKTTFSDTPCASPEHLKSQTHAPDFDPEEQRRVDQIRRQQRAYNEAYLDNRLASQQQDRPAIGSVKESARPMDQRAAFCASIEQAKARYCAAKDDWSRNQCSEMIYQHNSKCK